jgi:hypothetical protein
MPESRQPEGRRRGHRTLSSIAAEASEGWLDYRFLSHDVRDDQETEFRAASTSGGIYVQPLEAQPL